MTKHMGVQCKLHRFAYLIVQIILWFQSYFSHVIPSLYFSFLSPAPEINTGNFAPAETTSEAYAEDTLSGPNSTAAHTNKAI